MLWIGDKIPAPPPEVERFEQRSPRRPTPHWSSESFVIEDRPGGPTDSMGTAFAINRDGDWLTAEHVTHGCARIGLEDNGAARAVGRVLESGEADAALVRSGLESDVALPLAGRTPNVGTPGYHLGFPAGEPG